MAAGGAYHFYTTERRRQESLRFSSENALARTIEDFAEDDIRYWQVDLYFYRLGAIGTNAESLVAEQRQIPLRETALRNAHQIIQEILKGPTGEGARILPEEGWLRQLYLLEDGTVVVDLSRECSELMLGGVTRELAALRSITWSLRRNLPEICAVQFVVEGKRQPTFAGHISLLEPFM